MFFHTVLLVSPLTGDILYNIFLHFNLSLLSFKVNILDRVLNIFLRFIFTFTH